VNDHILLSRGTSSSYLVTTDDGDVAINVGTPYQGDRHRERYEQLLGRPLNVKTVIFTQCHPDHMGGWEAFAAPGVEIIAHRNYPDGRLDRVVLKEFFLPRSRRIVGGMSPSPEHLRNWFRETKEAPVSTLVDDAYAFERGGRRFELYSTPAGETTDCLIVHLPADKAVFTGNLMGALYGALPHMYTPRGDRQRSARQFVRDVDRVLSHQPELLLTGHDDPIVGAVRIRADLEKVRDAIAYIHDKTVEGMNAHKDLPTLMAEVVLPPEYDDLAPGRGPVHWYVRAVWEEYAGWFRQQYTSELYPTPASAVWPEVVGLAGGPEALAERAQRHVAEGRPEEAIHLLEMAFSVDAANRSARLAQIGALELLIERTGGRTYDELAWLEGELAQAKAAVGA
jgi:alkyl sulfatase BDS1-like metallo-beta-lactamase superfamily hydrolase